MQSRYVYVNKHHSGRFEVIMKRIDDSLYYYCDYSIEAIAVKNAIQLAMACNIEYKGII